MGQVPRVLHSQRFLAPFTSLHPTAKESESSIDDKQTYKHCNDLDDSNSIVRVDHMSASWSQDEATLVLNDITFEVNQRARLLAIIGPVGAGKVSANFFKNVVF